MYGRGLAVKDPLVHASVYNSHQCKDERLMTMSFELICKNMAVNFVVG